MAELKTGARLQSAVCAGEVMVVTAPQGDVDITCGGAAMVAAGVAGGSGGEQVAIDAEQAVGIVIGKRYISQDESLEVLCVKAGEGSLAMGGNLLLLKETKQLPKTD
ncbi:MAG: hypothetical protein GXP16_10255 [Gammaproteobacteria bacterium]|nr:hypothetical protein [Gammaproteobacteria bacterium]